jgi:hypothetical protein
MAIRDKSKLFLGIPLLTPDKRLGDPITGSFTTDTTAAVGGGALYNGTVIIPNPIGKKAFPISRYTEGGGVYYTDFDQTLAGATQNCTVITAVTASQIKYRWASVTAPNTVQYETILLSMD